MKIKEIDIRDVGIIQGQKLENLNEGLVVIGGLNRAGKTTFMNVLRHLGFGFNKGSDVPPPKFEYDVRSRFIMDNGESYDVMIKGYSKPEVKSINSKPTITINEIYNYLDSFTYRQLFTISLDELRRVSDKDEYKMQSVLLGAGLNDIVKIPKEVEELKKEADKIGGKKGTPSTKMFKPYNNIIRKGIDLKKAAVKNINVFKEKKQQLENTENLIDEKIKSIEKVGNEIIVLDILKNNYDLHYEMKELKHKCKNYNYDEGIKYNNAEFMGAELYKEYKVIDESYAEKAAKFKNVVSGDLNVKNILIKYKHQIQRFNSNLSGLKEKISNLFQLNEELNKKEYNLINKMKSINENWDSIEEIKELKADEIDHSILIDSVLKYSRLSEEKREYEKSIENLELEKNVLEGQIKDFKSINSSDFIKQYLYLVIIFIIVGFGVFYFERLLGISIIIVGAIGVGLYLFMKFNSSSVSVSKCKEKDVKLKQINKVLDGKNEKLKNILNDIENGDKEFDVYREMLKLDINVSPEGIKNYYSHLKNIKDDISDFECCKNKLKRLYKEINIELVDFSELVNVFSDVIDNKFDIKNPIKSYKEIFLAVEYLNKYLATAEELNIIEESKNLLEERIEKVLKMKFEPEDYLEAVQEYMLRGQEYKKFNGLREKCELLREKILQVIKTERVSAAIKKSSNYSEFSEESLLFIIEEFYREYASIDEIEEKYLKHIKNKEEMEDKLDSLKEQRQTLKYEINELSADKTLEKAQKLIHDGRESLKPLAEKYAVYNTAALILEKLQQNFMKEAKDTLLCGSGEILKNITSGELKEIQPMDDLSECDFKTVLEDGKVLEKSKMLSRGTKEQLFLAVRMNRIKEIKPALPVIFDDSFVNFDLKHTKKVVELLGELSRTHQIFVLTCHPQLVKLISHINDKAQYWKIEKGNFTLSNSEKLMKYLDI